MNGGACLIEQIMAPLEVRSRSERKIYFENLNDRILKTWQVEQGDTICQRPSRRMKNRTCKQQRWNNWRGPVAGQEA